MDPGERKVCKRCVLPESRPDLWIDEEGLCNICVEYDRTKNSCETDSVLETDFTKILNKYRGKKKYECLVMCSGGKDSTSALYYMTKRYKLNPLAFTFDHGFETEDAMENVRKAVEKLEVDFLFFKSDAMKAMFSKLLELDSRAVMCHPCSIWYMQLTYDMAARFDIPIIIAGWTKGQSLRQPVMTKCGCNASTPEFASMARATREFIEKHVHTDPQYKDFPTSMEDVMKRAKKKHKCMVLSPHWFLPFDQETYVDTIKREVDWKVPRLSYPKGTTNCYLNFISVYNSMKHYGYTHYHVEMSKMIRDGLMSREQALSDLEIDFDKDLLNSIAEKLDFRFE